ncbi:MAG TPA: hypothetical protein DHU78_01905 [Opitutae bacterium]|nr:hypothetical protein [Opitutae bacterium]
MIFTYFTVTSFTAVLAQSINNSLIESTILINIDSIKDKENYLPSGRRVLSIDQETEIENSIDFDELEPELVESQALIDGLKTVFENIVVEQPEEALSHAINYLAQNRLNFSLTDEQVASGLLSITNAFLEVFTEDEQLLEVPQIVLSAIIPERVAIWESSASKWVKLITHALIQSVPEDKTALMTGSILKSLLTIIKDEPSNTEIGFYSGIEPVEDFETPNENMKFDGNLGRFLKFDPVKTDLIRSAVYSMASSLFTTDSITEEKIDTLTQDHSKSIIEETFLFMKNLEGSNAIFTYELTKVISNAFVMGSVASMIDDEDYNSKEYPSLVAKEASEQIAFHVIDETLNLNMEGEWDLKRLAEATSFGSSVGAQMASILEKSMDFTPNWEKYERKQLAKSTAEGSSLGSTSARIDQAEENLSLATNVEESEGIAENARNDLLTISQHSSMGSLIGNVGISIYYPNPLDRLALINSAAQGATTGSITGVSAFDLTKEDATETFDIEIARSSSNGAAFGATFETIALTDANPRDFSSDSTTINVVQAVTYGSTFGAITAGNDPDVGAPAADAVIFKQATKQGSIEGSLNGASLGTGSSEENIDTYDLSSRSSIITAAASTNAQAASDASSSMATKAIRTSTSDMLMLMKKFNINPRLTNPTKIFNSKTSDNEEDEFLFEDNLEVASPI